MTLEEMFPGRAFLGAGSGEALNEVPCGADWPSAGEQIERLEQALEVITRLWAGETVTADHGWFAVKEAKLYTRAEHRPKLYVSAFGPQAAGVAGRWGDGIWTLGDPEAVPEIVEAYRAAARDAGREPGEVILHTGLRLGRGRARAHAGLAAVARHPAGEVYVEPIDTPAEGPALRPRPRSTTTRSRQGFVISSHVDEHVQRIRALEDLGATVVCLQNVSGADPFGTIRTYGEHVLPALRGRPRLGAGAWRGDAPAASGRGRARAAPRRPSSRRPRGTAPRRRPRRGQRARGGGAQREPRPDARRQPRERLGDRPGAARPRPTSP